MDGRPTDFERRRRARVQPVTIRINITTQARPAPICPVRPKVSPLCNQRDQASRRPPRFEVTNCDFTVSLPGFSKLETLNKNGNDMILDVLFSCLKRNCFQAEGMDEVLLKAEALRLPVRERVLLAEALLDSLDDDETRKIESAWAQEADSRMASYRRDEIPAEDGSKVIRELRERYGE